MTAPSSELARFPLTGGWPVWSPLRASDEHILIVRVPRAQEINRLPSPLLSCGSIPARDAGPSLPASSAPLPHFLNP